MVAMNPQTAREDAMCGAARRRAAGHDETLGLKEHPRRHQLLRGALRKLGRPGRDDARFASCWPTWSTSGSWRSSLHRSRRKSRRRSASSSSEEAKAAELNMQAPEGRAGICPEHLPRPTPSGSSAWTRRAGKIIIDGNAAAALGAMFGGVHGRDLVSDHAVDLARRELIDYMKQYRIDPKTGKATFAIVQAEDELAAIGMVDRGRLGRRARHDLHLRPRHLADVRVRRPRLLRRDPRGDLGHPARRPLHRPAHAHQPGRHPSTYLLSATATRNTSCCSRRTVEECFRFAQEAFNLAERFQTPVFCMSDLDLGMNNWMSRAVPVPRRQPDRSRQGAVGRGSRNGWQVLRATGTSTATASLTARCPARNHPAAAYFTRGSGHNEQARVQRAAGRLHQRSWTGSRARFETARARGARSRSSRTAGATVGIVAYGTTHHAIEECRDQLRAEHGIETDYLRIRALPLHRAVGDFLARARAHLRRGAEPRRADARHPGTRVVRSSPQAASGSALQRASHRCPLCHRAICRRKRSQK